MFAVFPGITTSFFHSSVQRGPQHLDIAQNLVCVHKWMTSCELDLMSRGWQGLWLLWLALQVEGGKEELKDSGPVKATRL